MIAVTLKRFQRSGDAPEVDRRVRFPLHDFGYTGQSSRLARGNGSVCERFGHYDIG
jgi:hypothetical protein